MDGTCSIPDCPRDRFARGFCPAHYMQWRRSPAGQAASRSARTCSEEGCGKPHSAKGYCAVHYMHYVYQGHAEAHVPRADRPKWKKPRKPPKDPEKVTWQAVHNRLYKARGTAGEHDCAHCERRARHWAYDHADPDVRTCKKSGFEFSTDLDRYIPLCTSCHKRFDAVHNGALLFTESVVIQQQQDLIAALLEKIAALEGAAEAA